MHSSSGCHHQITSWHQNLQSLPFFYVIMIPERCLNSLRHYSLLAFSALGVSLLLARANVSVLIFVVAAYSGGFLKVPKRKLHDGLLLTSRGEKRRSYRWIVVGCKDMVTDCEGLRIAFGMLWMQFSALWSCENVWNKIASVPSGPCVVTQEAQDIDKDPT